MLRRLIEGDAMSDEDDRAVDAVQRRLEAAGISVSDEELAVAVGVYRFFQAGMRLLYNLPEVRYAEPAVVFRPDPPLDDWTGLME
jgi:hypothetical protein